MPTERSIVILHPGRSGSHWLLYMLQRLTGLEIPRSEPDIAASPEGLIWGTRSHLDGLGQAQGLDVVFLLRDPRDVIVSAQLYNANIDSSVFKDPWHSVMDWCTWYLQAAPDIPTVRYEDLWYAPMSALARLFAAWGRQAPSAKALAGVVWSESFIRHTGRTRGTEDAGHHLRKGVIGDWRNYFTDEESLKFQACFQETLRALGYGQRC